MVILRNKSRGEIIIVCLTIFMTTHGNKRMLSQGIACYLTAYYVKKEPVLASYPFLSLLRRRKPEQHTACPNARSEKRKSKLKMIGRPQIQRRIQAHIL